MSTDRVHIVRARLTREKPPIRRAVLECTGEEIVYGVPGWQSEHYGFEPGSVDLHPGTLDHLVASVAGCLIGTFGGALKARGIAADGDRLVADVVGEVGVDPDRVLHLRRISVRYTLKAEESQRVAAERAHAHHAAHCPNARSVSPAIEVVTELDFVPVEAPAPV